MNDDQIDRLYALPLDEFTAARDALAKDLRAAGDKEGAQRIKALKKPNLAAWALNRLARTHAADIAELLKATENVRAVQRKVMSGARADLRAAADERNRIVTRLGKAARSILEEAGHAAAPQTLAAITDSLVAVSSDEAGDRLRAGRLTRELKSEAVMDVGPLGLVPPLEAESAPEKTIDTRVLERAVEQARKRADEAVKSVERAEGEATRLAEAAEFARRSAEARRAEVDEARKALAEAEEALREARS